MRPPDAEAMHAIHAEQNARSSSRRPRFASATTRVSSSSGSLTPVDEWTHVRARQRVRGPRADHGRHDPVGGRRLRRAVELDASHRDAVLRPAESKRLVCGIEVVFRGDDLVARAEAQARRARSPSSSSPSGRPGRAPRRDSAPERGAQRPRATPRTPEGGAPRSHRAPCAAARSPPGPGAGARRARRSLGSRSPGRARRSALAVVGRAVRRSRPPQRSRAPRDTSGGRDGGGAGNAASTQQLTPAQALVRLAAHPASGSWSWQSR